ncbi:hypothetical protein pb186bvf_012121 [Paramecium bursaria]
MVSIGGILTIFSLQIAQKIGILFHIRFLGILQCACLLIAPYTQNYFLFLATFYVLFGILEFVSGYPATTCLWSYYKGKEAVIQGLISAVVGLGIVIFILLITYLVNPDNKSASIQVQNGKNNFEYFDTEVANNVPIALKKITIGLAVMIFIGSFMIKRKSQKSSYFHQVNAQEFSGIEPPILESFEIEKLNSRSVLGELTFKQAVLSKDFLIIQSMNIVLLYFAITLSINYKVYALSKVNDDYYVTLIDLIAQINSALSNLFWGYLSHKIDYRKLLIFVFIMSGLTGMLLPIFGNNKVAFAVLYISVNIFERAVGIITLPAYLKLFGNYMGKRIFPITFVSSMIAAIVSPLSNLILINYVTYDQIFIYSGILVMSISLIPITLTRVPIS